MAYNPPGGPPPAYDWDAPVITGGAIIEAKAMHAVPPLSTNQLTNSMYTPAARKFSRVYGGVSRSARYMLKDIPANTDFVGDSNAQAISGVFRKFANDNGSCGATLILRHAAVDKFYCASVNFSGVEKLKLYGNRDEGSFVPGTGSDVLDRTITGVIDEDDWFGMRLTAATEGSDVRLRVFLALGATVLNSLDANGEPAWAEYLSCRHQSGSATPQDVVGATGTGTFGDSVPTLAGTPGFAFGGAYNGTDNWYYTGIRIKRMTL